MFLSLYQEYETETPQQFRSELMVLFKRDPDLQEKAKQQGNTLEKALNKIGREDIVKKCMFNYEVVTDDVEKAVARVRLDQPGFDSLKEELGPSRNTSLRRDATMDPKMDPDYDEPDRMKDSESVEDLNSSVKGKKTTKQHTPITNGTVYNATSTPIKDKYASDEKELGDMMAEFLEHKSHTSDTMVKKTRDEFDDENKKRQKVLADANKIVSDIAEEATRRAQLLADNANSMKQSENDFLQQSEPTFVETITTAINPETHERITQISRTTTSELVQSDITDGSEELRDSMHKIVDQFMTEERKGQ